MSVLRARRPMLVAALLGLSMTAAGCGFGGSGDAGGGGGLKAGPSQSSGLDAGESPVEPAAVVKTNVARGATNVPVDHRVTVRADNGTLASVSVSSHSGSIPGTMASDKTSWTAGGLLEPGTSYTVVSSVTDANGTSRTRTTHFRTAPLSLDQQTYPSFAPLNGQTVGIGMPVIVKFDVPVTDRA